VSCTALDGLELAVAGAEAELELAAAGGEAELELEPLLPHAAASNAIGAISAGNQFLITYSFRDRRGAGWRLTGEDAPDQAFLPATAPAPRRTPTPAGAPPPPYCG
jgi:hypothetical protein